MARLEELIQSIPKIETAAKSSNGGQIGYLLARQIVETVVNFLAKELPSMTLKVKTEDLDGVQRDLMGLNRAMGDLERTLKEREGAVTKSMPELVNVVGVLKDTISKLPAPKDFPTKLDVSLSKADLAALKPEKVMLPKMPNEMKVSNIQRVVDAVESLQTAVLSVGMPDEVVVKNLKDLKLKPAEIKFPAAALKALEKLNLLGRNPEDYIAVRLVEDGQFYKAMGDAVGSAVSLSPSPGDAKRAGGATFTLTLDGTVQRITTDDVYIHRLEMTGTAPFHWGYDTSVSHTGTLQGCKYLPNGLAQVINIDNVNKLYFKGTSGVVVCGNYLY